LSLVLGGTFSARGLFYHALGNQSCGYDVDVRANALVDRSDSRGPGGRGQTLTGICFWGVRLLGLEGAHVDRWDRLLASCAHAILLIGWKAHPVYTQSATQSV